MPSNFVQSIRLSGNTSTDGLDDDDDDVDGDSADGDDFSLANQKRGLLSSRVANSDRREQRAAANVMARVHAARNTINGIRVFLLVQPSNFLELLFDLVTSTIFVLYPVVTKQGSRGQDGNFFSRRQTSCLHDS